MTKTADLKIIQGGMGAGVSSWLLARAVAQTGQLGVVSGTALDVILARRLQDGDPGGHMQRALQHFPCQKTTQEILQQHFIPGGKDPSLPYKSLQMPSLNPSAAYLKLVVAANFVEVFLAKEGHTGLVGINYLEKIAIPHPPAIYGALLAQVDFILMGAGIPKKIPALIHHLRQHLPATYPLAAKGEGAGPVFTSFAPQEHFTSFPVLKSPDFLPIVSSHVLAQVLTRDEEHPVQGFILEGATAGGHNAPTRSRPTHPQTSLGDPQFAQVDFAKMRALNLPFWIAGGQTTPRHLQEALALGAQGIQVGSAFALCRESALAEPLKEALKQNIRENRLQVVTDSLASPTGFPFKVAPLETTLSQEDVYLQRSRLCDVGMLREIFPKPDGSIGYRCAAEPEAHYEKKGGLPADTQGRQCLCNALLANIGLGQIREKNYVEPGLLTLGDRMELIQMMLSKGDPYSARDVLEYLLSYRKTNSPQAPSRNQT